MKISPLSSATRLSRAINRVTIGFFFFIIVGVIVVVSLAPASHSTASRAVTPAPVETVPAEIKRAEPLPVPEPITPSAPTAPVVEVATVEPTPARYESRQIVLTEVPRIFEFVIKRPDAAEPVRVRGVAISYDGKVLTLDSYFSTQNNFLAAESLGQATAFQGWLARDAQQDLIIVRSQVSKCLAVPIVHRAYTQFAPDEELLLPLPTPENPNTARTVKPATGPDGSAPDAAADGFWIAGTFDRVLPGSPVLNRQKYLVGLVDDVRVADGLAHVKRIAGPLTLLNEATQQVRAHDWSDGAAVSDQWTQEETDPALREILFTLTGEALNQACAAVIERHPDSARVWRAATAGYDRAGQREYAIASARMLTKVAPKEWESWFAYGQQLERSQRYGEALDAYQLAADGNGPLRRLGVPMARCLYRGKDPSGTQEMLRRVLESDADNYDAWIFSGTLYLENKNYEGASRAFLQAASINPQSPEAWQSLGEAYDQSANTAEAVRAFKQLTLLQPGNAVAWNRLGVALTKTHQDTPARASFRRALQLNPNDTQARHYLAQLESQSVGGGVVVK